MIVIITNVYFLNDLGSCFFSKYGNFVFFKMIIILMIKKLR